MFIVHMKTPQRLEFPGHKSCGHFAEVSRRVCNIVANQVYLQQRVALLDLYLTCVALLEIWLIAY